MSRAIFDHYFRNDSINNNNHSGITIQNIEMNLTKDIFLKILCLENKIEKKYTIQHMDSLIVLYSQLVEHYNMKRDPIYIYFLEKIKNYLAKTNSLKLYFKTEKESIDKQNNTWIHESDDSILYSDEERSPNKVLKDISSHTPNLLQQQSGMRRDSFENLIEQKRQILRKSISFINYQQAKKSQLKEEIYDLERKRNERNLKLNVFKEVFVNSDNKNNEVKEIIKNYEELSKEKDNLVKSDLDQQMNSIQQRIQIKRNNQFKKSLTIELNTPRSHREETSTKLSIVPNSQRNDRQSHTENEYSSPQVHSARQYETHNIQQLSPSERLHSDMDIYTSNQSQEKQNNKLQHKSGKKAVFSIKNFHEKLGIEKTNFQDYVPQNRDGNTVSQQDPSLSSDNDDNEDQVDNIDNQDKKDKSKKQPSLIKEVLSQEHSFSQKESMSPSKYMKDFGYDNE